jgi:hypothetical protein
MVKAKKTKKVTLKRIQSKAIADPEFFRSLREDAQRTLGENAMNLGAADSRRLKEILALDGKTIEVDLDQLMKRARKNSHLGAGEIPGVGWIFMWKRPLPILGPKASRSTR